MTSAFLIPASTTCAKYSASPYRRSLYPPQPPARSTSRVRIARTFLGCGDLPVRRLPRSGLQNEPNVLRSQHLKQVGALDTHLRTCVGNLDLASVLRFGQLMRHNNVVGRMSECNELVVGARKKRVLGGGSIV